MGVGTILRCIRKCQNQASKRLGTTSRGGRIRSRSILRRKRFWTSMNGLLGGQECGCLSGGDIRKAWNWRG